MTWVWTGMVTAALGYSLAAGTAGATGAAALEGAAAAVRLTVSLAGPLLLWSALTEALERTGAAAALGRILRPVLGRLFPSSRTDEALAADLSCNLGANLLGLGNAATPPGVRAAVRLRTHAGGDAASDVLCRLAVLNSASLQLLPMTVAALRASLGAAAPFDVLPAVWITSAVSVGAGLLLAVVGLLGLGRRTDVFSALTDGAKNGLALVGRILCALVALLPAVYMLRSSGAMDALAALLAPLLSRLGIPPETVPLMLVRPLSGSGALAVGGELMAASGVDSPAGRTAAVMLGSTETTFYVLTVYFSAAGIRRPRHALAAALCADAAGFLAASWCVRLLG